MLSISVLASVLMFWLWCQLSFIAGIEPGCAMITGQCLACMNRWTPKSVTNKQTNKQTNALCACHCPAYETRRPHQTRTRKTYPLGDPQLITDWTRNQFLNDTTKTSFQANARACFRHSVTLAQKQNSAGISPSLNRKFFFFSARSIYLFGKHSAHMANICPSSDIISESIMHS